MKTGYPLSIFGDNLDESLKCSQCQLILRQPVQVTCGHRFCNNCWEQITGETSTPVCPGCQGNGDEQVEALQANPDNGIQRQMNRMIAHCPSSDCKWSGSFKDFQNHYVSCDGQSREQEEVEQQQATEQDNTGMTSRPHDELQLIRAILTMFCAMSLFHVLCYMNYQARAMVNRGLHRVMEASQLQQDALESLPGRVSALEGASYGGKLIWKITKIGSRIRDAVSGRVKVLLSPDIYTNKQGSEGYKIKALLYPNGAQEHLSLYFEAIEGPTDALMKWPFHAKIMVKFLDQAGQIRVDETFRASFNCPGSSESVTRHGFVKFLSQSSLLPKDGGRCSPTNEDSVFIDIKVEDEGPCNGKKGKGRYTGAQL